MELLNLPRESENALLNGATMFIELIDKKFQGKIPEKATSFELLMFAQMVATYYLNDKLTIDGREIGTIKNVSVVRVQDMFSLGISASLGAWSKDTEDFTNWYNKQYGNYADNPYVFLYEIEKG